MAAMYDKGIDRAVRGVAILALAGLLLPSASAAPPARGPASLADSARASATAAATKVWQGAQDVALFALGLIGVDYRFGGETPDRGLDCSGLIRYVFQEVTGTTLPRTSREMSRLGAKVALADLKPGDLVFFNTRRFAFSHVGLYLGDNRFIHAPSTGGEVEVATLSQDYWKRRFDGARRLVGVLPSLVPTIINSANAAPLRPLRSDLTPSDPALTHENDGP
jgi:cell wall-associated NlpC family hydrolase